MERDARYAAVALFALVAIAATVAFVVWYSGHGESREYVRYEIYFDGSVSGLSRGSPVRYLGVDVGRVAGLALDKANPGRVRVLADVDAQAPVNGATRARLGMLGLTGLLYIDLQTAPDANPAQALARGREYPVIPSQQGDIEAFLAKMPDLLGRVAGVTERLESLLSEPNVAAASETLQNVATASRELPAITREAAALATDLRQTSNEVGELAVSLRAASDRAGPRLDKALDGLAVAADRLGQTAASLDRIVGGNEATLSRFAGQGVTNLEQLIADLRQTNEELRELARRLRDNPSSLVIERRESGVEVPP
jgi:phospholipid/cholesterol/gamma-HCH transport system substrate-binding protein